jgi:hypothetical protein
MPPKSEARPESYEPIVFMDGEIANDLFGHKKIRSGISPSENKF